MESIISTSRLKLTLLTEAARGSAEFEWLHELRTNEQATWWSIHGKAQSVEDTEKVIQTYMPTNEDGEKKYRVAYAVHEIAESEETLEAKEKLTTRETRPSKFIGLITLKSLDAGNLVLPENLTLVEVDVTTTLTVELAYQFLPHAWGKGYATEALIAVFDGLEKLRPTWSQFSKLYIRAVVNASNKPSLRVMEKAGMTSCGAYEWKGKPVFVAGQWREQDTLCIFGKLLPL